MMGQQLIEAWLRPAIPWTAPGPETVSRAAGMPVRNPAAAAAYPAACSLRNPMKRMPAAWETRSRQKEERESEELIGGAYML